MDTKTDAAKATLNAMGFPSDRVEAAVAALEHEAKTEPQRPISEALLTPRQLCDRLQISMTSLWRQRPPCIKVGARKRYLLSEVLDFMNHRKLEGGAA
ncbi:MAG: hypothetical protein PHW08_09815 [Kiritimatiellae bacterium]|nr:hypothetical protein [Kiritimatiellia bacterium]